MPARPERRLLAAVALIALLLSACQVRVTVGVDARDDGSGSVRAEVRLDRDAAARVTDLGRELRTDDLAASGWVVTTPRTATDGSVTVVATKPFGDPADVQRIVGELSGEDGPFHTFRLEQRRGLFSTTTRLRGEVDLTSGLDGFGDEDLETVTGSRSGVDERALETQLGRALDEVFTVVVAARLPGEVETNARGSTAVWRPKLGEHITIEADATQTRWLAIAAVAVLVTGLVGLALLLLGRRRRRAPA